MFFQFVTTKSFAFFRRAGVGFVIMAGIATGFSCGSGEDIRPVIPYPGYKASLVFEDAFESGLKNWILTGNGTAVVASDGRLHISESDSGSGVAVWTEKQYNLDFLLEYHVEFRGSTGLGIVFFCAQGADGERLTETLQPENGSARFTYSRIQGYQITYHCYLPDGQHVGASRVRKNPGNLLLARVDHDPCREDRNYFLTVVKTGNRIQFYVDGVMIHDLRDKGGFGPTYSEGRIGFWFQGGSGSFSALLDDVRLFRLSPE